MIDTNAIVEQIKDAACAVITIGADAGDKLGAATILKGNLSDIMGLLSGVIHVIVRKHCPRGMDQTRFEAMVIKDLIDAVATGDIDNVEESDIQ